VPQRYILAEKSNTTVGASANHTSSGASNNATAPPAAEQGSHKHRVRNWIIGFVVGSLAGVISGLGLSVLLRLALNCIRWRHRKSKSGTVIYTPKLIKRADHLAFLEKEDVVSSLEVIGRGEVFKAPLPTEREGEEPRFIAIKKIKKQVGDGPGRLSSNLSDEESRQLDKCRTCQVVAPDPVGDQHPAPQPAAAGGARATARLPLPGVRVHEERQPPQRAQEAAAGRLCCRRARGQQQHEQHGGGQQEQQGGDAVVAGAAAGGGGHRVGAGVPARVAAAADHPPRPETRKHPPRRRHGGAHRGLRASQGDAG